MLDSKLEGYVAPYLTFILHFYLITGSEHFPEIPGWVVQLVRAFSQYAKVVGLIPGQSTHKNQPVNASISGTTNQCFSLSL